MKKVFAIFAMVGFLASAAVMAEEKVDNNAAKENLSAKASEKKVEKKEEAVHEGKKAKKEVKEVKEVKKEVKEEQAK